MLARPDLISRRRPLIQSLVPIAASDPTALDTVLARLLLVTPEISQEHLDKIERLALAIQSLSTDGGVRYQLIGA